MMHSMLKTAARKVSIANVKSLTSSNAVARMGAAKTNASFFSTEAKGINYSVPVAPSNDEWEGLYRFGIKEEDFDFKSIVEGDEPAEAEISEETVKRVLSLSNAAMADKVKHQLANSIKAFERFPGDTGSPEVQIAVATMKIKHLTQHSIEHKKDRHSRRGLIKVVNHRKKMLKYLKRTDLDKFKAVVAALGIRAN